MTDELLEILSRGMGLKPEIIKPDLLLYEYCDELDIAEMAGDIEETFDLNIPEDVIDNWSRVKDIVEYVENAK